MAYRILYTEDALADLEGIVDFISSENASAAARFATSLLNHVELLAAFPRMGVAVTKRPGVRKIFHSPVRVYYRVRDDVGVIEILHFWHAARRDPVL